MAVNTTVGSVGLGQRLQTLLPPEDSLYLGDEYHCLLNTKCILHPPSYVCKNAIYLSILRPVS